MELTGRREPHRTIRRLLAGILATLIVFLGAVSMSQLNAPHASAATKGSGTTYDKIGYLGSFRLDNHQHAYCVEIKVHEPWGAQQPEQLVTTLPGFNGDLVLGTVLGLGGVELKMPALTDEARMRQINYIISTWGDTEDPAQGSAVALAVFETRGDPIGYNEALQNIMHTLGGTAVAERAQHMVAEARLKAVAPVQAVEADAPHLTMNETGNGTLEFFPGTTKLELTHAVFADTGDSVREVSPSAGGTLDIRSVKPDGWDATYEILADAYWTSGSEGWRAELVLHEAVVPGEQRIVTATGKTTDVTRSGVATSLVEASHTWAPTISTQVSQRIIEVGDTFTDTVTVEAHADGGSWSTTSEGEYMPLYARGTLYGPLDHDPALSPSAVAPEGTPVAAEVSLHINRGPDTYEVSAPGIAKDTGFYTWVWSLDWEDQEEAVTNPERTGKSALNAEAFPVRDSFGLAAETHLVQQRMNLVTRLIDGEVGLGWSLIDDVAIIPEDFGGWLTDHNGERVPVTMRGTVYHSEIQPERAANAPGHARIIAETSITTNESGIIESAPIPLPLDSAGYVTVQWCILEEDQDERYHNYTREFCDDYGIPAETAQVSRPTVATQAQPEAVAGDTIYDDAFVEGLIPNESSLSFTAYLYPEPGSPKFSDTWEDTGTVWTEDELRELDERERCLAQPVSTTEPFGVTEAGTHRSPEVHTGSAGTIHWVERLFAVDPTTGITELVHEGECGLVNETTLISEPQVIPEPPLVEEPQQPEELAHTGTVIAPSALSVSAFLLVTAGILLVLRRRIT